MVLVWEGGRGDRLGTVHTSHSTDLCRWTVGEMSATALCRCDKTEENNSARPPDPTHSDPSDHMNKLWLLVWLGDVIK